MLGFALLTTSLRLGGYFNLFYGRIFNF